MFYAYQFIQLHEELIRSQNKEDEEYNTRSNTSFKALINYMTLNQITDFDINFKINKALDCITNINNYL